VNKVLLLWGFGSGVVAVLGYLFHGLKTGRKWSSEDAVSILASGGGVASAVQVCWVAIVYWDQPPIEGVWAQMFVGGFALGLFALRSAARKFSSE
jgi:hypothetical protein